MRNTKQRQRSPIGIYYDYNEFRAVQCSTRDRPAPHSIVNLPRQSTRKLTPTIEELKSFASVLAQRGFVGNQVALAVPKESASFHILDLPPAGSGAPIHRLALLEAQRSGAHQTEALEVGYWCQPRGQQSAKSASPYYTVACETEPLDELVDRFEAAGLVPIGVEPIETALARAATAHDEFVDGSIHCVIEIGWDHSWAIITLGSTPVYTRKIDCGASSIRRQFIDDHAMPVHSINTLLNTDQQSLDPSSRVGRIFTTLLNPMLVEMVSQLDIALTYVSQQHRTAPFGVVFRSGYFSDLDQTAHSIAKRTGMPTMQLQVVHELTQGSAAMTPFEISQSPRLNIATGLAMGAAA